MVEMVFDFELWGSGYFYIVVDCCGEDCLIFGLLWFMIDVVCFNCGVFKFGQDNCYVLGELLGLLDEEQ